MDLMQKTIKMFFSMDNIQFIIPDYQRAYSWEEDQCKEFYNDILEQSKNENKYFFGNILVENLTCKNILEIVDGQQRLTTIIIFISAVISILEKHHKTDITNIDIEKLKQVYIIKNGQQKIIPSKIDQKYFEKVIIHNNTSKTSTQSQKKINNAKNYFLRKLKSIKDIEIIIKMINKLEQSIVTITKLYSKTDAAFMFELQNNRGKEITEMEQVKSYLMYQIYMNEKPISMNKTISKLSETYEKIYLSINRIQIKEDDLLWYHCNAYYGYSSIDDNYDAILDFLKEIVVKIKENHVKVSFIIDFVSELQKTFENIEQMETDNKNIYIRRLQLLGRPCYKKLYPLIINGYRYYKDSKDYFLKLFHIIELLAFRISLIRTNGNIKLNSRLDKIVNYEGDLNYLYIGIKENFAGDEWRWTDETMEEVLNGPFYRKVTDNILCYILKIYEEIISGKEFPKLKKIQIEHIAPQNPKKENNTGYELTKQHKYSAKFRNNYLDCLGNLVLSTEKQNRDLLSNKNFKEKLTIYGNNKLNLGLKQQKEIETFLKDEKLQWGYTEIDSRHEKLVEFVMNEWGFENMTKTKTAKITYIT